MCCMVLSNGGFCCYHFLSHQGISHKSAARGPRDIHTFFGKQQKRKRPDHSSDSIFLTVYGAVIQVINFYTYLKSGNNTVCLRLGTTWRLNETIYTNLLHKLSRTKCGLDCQSCRAQPQRCCARVAFCWSHELSLPYSSGRSVNTAILNFWPREVLRYSK